MDPDAYHGNAQGVRTDIRPPSAHALSGSDSTHSEKFRRPAHRQLGHRTVPQRADRHARGRRVPHALPAASHRPREIHYDTLMLLRQVDDSSYKVPAGWACPPALTPRATRAESAITCPWQTARARAGARPGLRIAAGRAERNLVRAASRDRCGASRNRACRHYQRRSRSIPERREVAALQ